MSDEHNSACNSQLRLEPVTKAARDFSRRMSGLMDGQPKEAEAVAKVLEGMDDIFDQIAAGLYSMASMLVGEGEQSVRLVEEAVAKAEISVCNDPVQARQSSRRALAVAALAQLAESRMGCLAAPVKVEQMVSCIDDDDLGAAGISSAELEVMISGPEREQLRLWLAGLPIRMRAVFVLRAVGGFTAAETAALLSAHGGTDVAGWSLEAVRMVFRQGLCLLASQLLQASSVK